VSDGYDLDDPVNPAIDQREREPPEKIPARSRDMKGPSGGSLGDLKNRMVNLG